MTEMQAAAAAAAEAAARRGAEAAARQAHRHELRQKEEAQALLNLRAFKDSIKAAVSRVPHCWLNINLPCVFTAVLSVCQGVALTFIFAQCMGTLCQALLKQSPGKVVSQSRSCLLCGYSRLCDVPPNPCFASMTSCIWASQSTWKKCSQAESLL